MFLETDILIAGAGLSGLCAAIAASGHQARVAVLAPRSGIGDHPAQLLLQAPHTPDQRAALRERLITLSAPGHVLPSLVDTMIDDAEAAFHFLCEAGVNMRARFDGTPVRRGACHLPDVESALVLHGQEQTLSVLRAEAQNRGAELLPGLSLVAIGADGEAPGSALAVDRKGNVAYIRARVVIIASGGTAALFAAPSAPPSEGGTGLGLLRQADVHLANAAFHEMFWVTSDGELFNPGTALMEGMNLIGPEGGAMIVPDALQEHATERSAHFTHAWGRPDADVDHYLLANLNPAGVVGVRLRKQGIQYIQPVVHSSTGGVVIGPNGETGVPGLFACGGCTTGMYGANAVGGTHALASAVFGRRAGVAALALAASTLMPSAPDAVISNPRLLPLRLREAMRTNCLPGPRPGLPQFIERLQALAGLPSLPLLERCRLLSALTIAEQRARLPH